MTDTSKITEAKALANDIRTVRDWAVSEQGWDDGAFNRVLGAAESVVKAQTEPPAEDVREALIEALARIEVMQDGAGDFGGPYHTEDAYAVDMYVRYVGACHSDPPDWERASDPLAETSDRYERDVTARAAEIRARVREQVADYAGRTGHFKTWWRTDAPAVLPKKGQDQ